MPFEALSPIGRLVGGSPLQGYQDTDEKTNAKLFNEDGTPQMSYLAMLAINKQDPAWQGLYAQLWDAGRAAFPNLFGPDGACLRNDFSWKIIDGDGRDNQGKSYADREGYPGHMLLKVESKYPFTCYDVNNTQIIDPNVLYRGCFIRVAMKVQSNNATGNQKPGIKIYPQGLQMVGHGTRISSGPDASQLFAAPVTAGYVPQGMSNTPPAGAPMPGINPQGQAMPGIAQQPAPGMQPMQAQQPAPGMQPMQAQQPAPGIAVAQPNHQFVQQAINPTPQHVMTAAAQGYTKEQWNQQGYNDETLIQHGMMVIQ